MLNPGASNSRIMGLNGQEEETVTRTHRERELCGEGNVIEAMTYLKKKSLG